MTTWDEWFAYLDARLDACIGGQLPDIHELLRDTEQSRSGLDLVSMGPHARVFDELWTTARFLASLEKTAQECHYRAASLLYAQGRKAAWFPAALPNSEDSRVARRVVAAAASRRETSRIARGKLA